MLAPKRVKHRKQFRGRMRGNSKGGTNVNFGEYGLKAMDRGWITSRQIEAARVAMTHQDQAWRQGLDHDLPRQAVHQEGRPRPAWVRASNPEGWVAVVKPGRIMFELSGVPEDLAREAMEPHAAPGYPLKTKFVTKGQS